MKTEQAIRKAVAGSFTGGVDAVVKSILPIFSDLEAEYRQQVEKEVRQDRELIATLLRALPTLSPDSRQKYIEKPALLKGLADKLSGDSSPAKFAVLADLGIITVPDNYDHATQLAAFLKKNRKKFYGVNDNITDANFSNPSRVLQPGSKLRVVAFKQIVSGTTSSEERLSFLATQSAVYTGAQGASLVFEQKRDQLPKGYWYTSFDEKNRLWKDAGGYHRVPYLYAYSGGVFNFHLGSFGLDWRSGRAFFGFCDVE